MVASPASARILIVCTANAIRSPFLEHLLRARLAALGPGRWEIGSAGTAARPGYPAEPQVVEIGRVHGLELAHHRTRRLTEAMLESGTTVLCAAAAHRRVVLDMRPHLLDSVFTVREFARLLDARGGAPAAPHDWNSLVAVASRRRTRVRADAPTDDDLVDPIGQPAEVWAEFERDATAAVDVILRYVAARGAGGAAGRISGTAPLTRRELRAARAEGAAASQ